MSKQAGVTAQVARPTQIAAPVTHADRITNLDTVRGIATLGILVMNAVSFGLVDAAYFNLDAAPDQSWLDWTVGVFGEVFVDQKTMALFSMLFGAGIVLFVDRAEAKGKRAVALSTWRNVLLLGIGALHAALWDGDVLVIYALCSPVLLAMRKRSPQALWITGSAMVLTSAVLAVVTQPFVADDGSGLGGYWTTDGTLADGPGLFLLSDFFLRSLGMMLIGVALYRTGYMQGTQPIARYKTMALVGLGVGIPIAIAGVVWQAAAGFSIDIAVIGEAPNTVATIPMAVGYLGLITLWDRRPVTAIHDRVRAVGRMALTNYLTHTLIGITLFRVIFDRGDASRSTVALFVMAVWLLQLIWSKPWLDRFRFGPFEWLWRSATYRKLQPMRR